MNALNPRTPDGGRITRTFKSGNSVAVRLPKDMGFVEGDEVTIIDHEDGTFSIWKVDDGRKILMNLFGSMSSGFMAEGRGDVEQEERDWTPRGAGPDAA